MLFVSLERKRPSKVDVVMVWALARSHFYSVGLGSAPPMPPSLPGLPAQTCVGTLPRWEPMQQYPVKITNIQVDITFIILKLIDEVPSHAKGA